jgi:hypothetical protein
MRFCECGRPWETTKVSCKYPGHEEFDSATYGKKHFKKAAKKHGGYSAQRDQDGQFQHGVDKDNFK